jgi:hypothetical protein
MMPYCGIDARNGGDLDRSPSQNKKRRPAKKRAAA